MSASTPDIVDLLVGIEPNSRLDAIRAQRPEARENTQKSYLALFEPRDPGKVTPAERYAVASFVAGLHREAAVAEFYAGRLAEQNGRASIAEIIATEVVRGAAHGPYGSYPRGPLSREDTSGPVHKVSEEHRRILGPRLCAALEHAHLLVFRPRDAKPEALQALLDAGWSTTDIVTLSQLVAFLSFQIRTVVGLRALTGEHRHG
jgi:CMD domain protein